MLRVKKGAFTAPFPVQKTLNFSGFQPNIHGLWLPPGSSDKVQARRATKPAPIRRTSLPEPDRHRHPAPSPSHHTRPQPAPGPLPCHDKGGNSRDSSGLTQLPPFKPLMVIKVCISPRRIRSVTLLPLSNWASSLFS